VSLAEVSIRRPVLASVLSMVLVVFGIVGYTFLGVREYPAVDPPIISVRADYPGAHPEVIASQITEPLEQQINGIPGVRDVASVSSEARSNIRVEFGIGTDLEAAANDVRDKVAQAVRDLPVDADPPVVQKSDADAEPILFLNLRSNARPILEISDFAERVVKERLQTIAGVGEVRIFGEKRMSMRLWIDPVRLAAHGLSMLDVESALTAENVDLPSGRLEGATVDLALRTHGRLETEADFDAMVVGVTGDRQILLRDVGRAELAPENLRGGAKVGGFPSVMLAVIPQPNTNAIAIADEFYRRIDAIKGELPDDVILTVAYDFTKFVRRSIREVQETVVTAFLLVVAIIFIFLRNWRSTLIPVIAIPVSIISTFFVMYVAGFSINVLTLIGIVLAVGLVVDDAIVVLENIHTKIEAGMPPLEAAVAGSREIYFAVISTTLALAAVFVPILFLEGLTGRLFREFGVVLVGAVLVSSFVALSLTPSLCRLFLRRETSHGAVHRWSESVLDALGEAYTNSLASFLGRRWLVVPILGLSAAAIAALLAYLPQELAPLEDRSSLRITVRGPEGASFEYMDHHMDKLATYVADELPEVETGLSIVGAGGMGVSTGRLILFLSDPEERSRSQQQVFQQFSDDAGRFTGTRVFPSQPPTIGDRRSGQPVKYVLQAATLEELVEVLPPFLEAASARPELRFVDLDLKIDRPEGSIAIDRRKAADLGVSARDIARTLQLAYGGSRLGYFLRSGRQYQVIGQVERADRNEPGDLRSLWVKSARGELVPLDSLVILTERASPSAIYRYNRFTSATLSAGLAPGSAIGDGVRAFDEVAASVLPNTIRTSLTGQARDFAESSSSLLFAFLLALLVVYLVLAAQFESFVDPLIILVTVPLSLVGALASLALLGQTLNVFSQIGMIMLIGLVTKNGILIVEFANQRREAGMPLSEAVLSAARARLRPVLMTSLSTILGILPIALALGSSSGSRRPLGIAVVGGLVLSTALTLYVVPAVYSFLSRTRSETAG
jgi:multidrug efflux pump